MRILFDKNVPVGVRSFLAGHEVHTVVEMGWPDQLENGAMTFDYRMRSGIGRSRNALALIRAVGFEV